jgi:signal peptidase II
MKRAWIAGAVLVLDQAAKWIVKSSMVVGQSVRVLGDPVRLTYVENPGMAFGLRLGNGTLFTIFSAAACILLVVYLWMRRKEGAVETVGLFLILGGAAGNLIDRLAFGKVVDFVDLGVRTVRWPVFNVADSAVVIGMGILLFLMFREDRRAAARAKLSPDSQP